MNRWNAPAASLAAPIASIMYPSWLTVENAITRLMSVATRPIEAAKIAVNPPMNATVSIAGGACSNSGNARPTM